MRATKIARGAIVVSLVSTLLLPTAAMALDRPVRPRPEAPLSDVSERAAVPSQSDEQVEPGERLEQLRERLRERIENAIRRHHARFVEAAARIQRRIDRIDGLATRVENAGGDVSLVRAKLAEARESLENAETLEAEAMDQFSAIPNADDKREALHEARQTARAAREALDRSRSRLREAARELGAIIRDMKAAG